MLSRIPKVDSRNEGSLLKHAQEVLDMSTYLDEIRNDGVAEQPVDID